MSELLLRPVCEQDTVHIVEIYNSNPAFLTAHLGRKSVDAAFLLQDHADAESAGFLCCVLEAEGGRIAGVMDYRPGRTAYLSLLMLDKAYQGQGLGAACCRLFEERMCKEGCEAVRIDVVGGYAGCALGFWQAQGYRTKGETDLEWGAKRSRASILIKRLVPAEPERRTPHESV
ncbi:MAG: GNAT family N-acetyltransferase [Clostridiales bacterium]|nr:GNAT family N-acetyltransferase [Clostridiales bacterium]